MHSCIYEGRVQHARQAPISHRFDYRLAMVYLDLNEMEQAVGAGRCISAWRFAPASFLSADHQRALGTSDRFAGGAELSTQIREFVAKNSGSPPAGPIRLLTQLRYFGHYFSPLNLYYCFAPDGSHVESIVAEVSNTPWNERHLYVLHRGNQLSANRVLRYRHPKSFHVSPFMGMEATYDWRLSTPGSRLAASIRSSRAGQPFFQAALAMRRRPLTHKGVRSLLIRYPLMNARIIAAIYWQAVLLWKKKCPFYPHPQNLTDLTS
ncbi:MAG: DUF1365 domain-containing protein [Bythopirellula sp.]